MRSRPYNGRLGRPKKSKENSGKDIWDKLKIAGGFSTAFIVAFGAIIGSVYIPDKISQHSLRSEKIIELSALVPQLYDSSKAIRPTAIAMASYGEPAISFLLLALDDAIDNNNSKMKDAIVSAMKFMDAESKGEIISRLEIEMAQLDHPALSPLCIERIKCMVEILGWPRFDEKSVEILKQYFVTISRFPDIGYRFKDLNGAILRQLSNCHFPISELELRGVDLTKQDLKEIDFSNADLTKSNFWLANLYQCNFKGAILDSCDLRKAQFFTNVDDSAFVLGIFTRLAQSDWESAFLDSTVSDILYELELRPSDTLRLLELSTIAIEDAF